MVDYMISTIKRFEQFNPFNVSKKQSIYKFSDKCEQEFILFLTCSFKSF